MAAWTVEDLVQEVYAKVLARLDRFGGQSRLKTWVYAVARNHLLSLARGAAARPRLVGSEEVDHFSGAPGADRGVIRGEVASLLEWLRGPEGRAEIEYGYEVLNLMLYSGASHAVVAFKLSHATSNPWTEEGVRNVLRKIRATTRGAGLCETVGLRAPSGGDE